VEREGPLGLFPGDFFGQQRGSGVGVSSAALFLSPVMEADAAFRAPWPPGMG
jgi:hypothetical protein